MDQATILVVDDDPQTLEVLDEYFRGHGFDVVTAKNGVEALSQVTRHRPRAVILDLFMPRLGGLGALDRIRHLDSSIAIVLISGVAAAADLVKKAGVIAAGVLEKPFDPSQLLGMLLEAGVVPPEVAGGPRGIPAQARRQRRRVLIVDDDAEVRNLLAEYLQGNNFETATAADGQEAIRQVPQFRPHLVLLDIKMPGLSGLEALRCIKALPEETCVIMISGQDELETARRTLAMGAADYVSKPVDFSYLDSVLGTHATPCI